MRFLRLLLGAAIACVAVVAMTATAWAQDEHPTGTLTNPVIEDSMGNPIGGPVGFVAQSQSSVLTTANPAQGPFDCLVTIEEGTIDDAGGGVTLDDVTIGPGTDPECGNFFQAQHFSLPWPGQVCLEDNGAGNFTAWLHLNIVELTTPLQSYGSNNNSPGNENLWVRLIPSEQPLPVGPVSDAHLHDTIPGFTSGSLTIVGAYLVNTEIPLFADNGGGSCS